MRVLIAICCIKCEAAPDPTTLLRSTPFSSASFLAKGLATTRPPAGAAEGEGEGATAAAGEGEEGAAAGAAAAGADPPLAAKAATLSMSS